MKKNFFTLRVTDTGTGAVEMLTLDLDVPLPEQLRAVAGKWAQMKLYVSAEKDYDATMVFEILKALGGNVRMNIVADTPEAAGINADLVIENRPLTLF